MIILIFNSNSLLYTCLVSRSLMPRISRFNEFLPKLRKYLFDHHSLPTFQELADLLGAKSKHAVSYFYNALINEGYMVKGETGYFPTEAMMAIPIYASVQAGKPSSSQDEVPESINIQSALIRNPNTTIAIKVVGDSMIDQGIQPWDCVLVDKLAPYKIGDTVVAMIENECTIKLLMGTEKGYFLSAANAQKQYPDIHPTTERTIVGKVVSSFRLYN